MGQRYKCILKGSLKQWHKETFIEEILLIWSIISDSWSDECKRPLFELLLKSYDNCHRFWIFFQREVGDLNFVFLSKKHVQKRLRNDMFITFLQQILSGRLLLVVIVGQKSNLSVSFKFELITTNYLWFVTKML